MPRSERNPEAWHVFLTTEEASLVEDFDKIIEVCRSCLADAYRKRSTIRTRAQTRLKYRESKGEKP